MFNIGGGEFLIIFLVALIVLGPTKLPEAARQVGKVVGEFRRISSGFQRELQEAMKDPVGDAIRDAEAEVDGQPTASAAKPAATIDVTEVAQPGPIDSPETASVDPPNTDPTAQNETADGDPPMFGDR